MKNIKEIENEKFDVKTALDEEIKKGRKLTNKKEIQVN